MIAVIVTVQYHWLPHTGTINIETIGSVPLVTSYRYHKYRNYMVVHGIVILHNWEPIITNIE